MYNCHRGKLFLHNSLRKKCQPLYMVEIPCIFIEMYKNIGESLIDFLPILSYNGTTYRKELKL